MNAPDILKYFSLSEKESAVYAALLELGEGTVQKIARKAGIKRPTAYVVLEELRKKEAVLKVPQAKRAIYIAKSPRELYERDADRLREVARAVPILEAIRKKSDRANTLYFEGVKGIEESLYYRHGELRGTTIDGFWAKVDLWDEKLKKMFNKWGKRNVELGINIRAIAPHDSSLKEYRQTDATFNRFVKSIPQSLYSSTTSIEATDLFVRITQFKSPQAIIIESPEMVTAVKEIFEIVWNSVSER